MAKWLISYPAVWHDDTQQGFKTAKADFEKKTTKNNIFGVTVQKMLKALGRVLKQDVYAIFDYKPLNNQSTEITIIAYATGTMLEITNEPARLWAAGVVKKLGRENRQFTITEVKNG